MFADRLDAGEKLAERLQHLRAADPVVVGLPRGGVPVAGVVARSLGAPLDVIVVRKIGVPVQPELAMGAIGEDGVRVLNRNVLAQTRVTSDQWDAVERRERQELERRAKAFRAGRHRVGLRGRTVIVVDDGIATGSTAHVACQVARIEGAARVVLAVPVAPPDWTERLGDAADEYVAVDTPEPFYGVGQFYRDFRQTTDDEVTRWLHDSVAWSSPSSAGDLGVGARDEEVVVEVGRAQVKGHLVVPAGATGVVIFAHGSGSSRHSPRNRFVAEVLNESGLATLLFDLLTVDEELDRANVFDVGLLGRRLAEVTDWVRRQAGIGRLPIGYFGASTGAAAALVAAAQRGAGVAAVVSRGGRPDLAGPWLASVDAPTLLVVGGNDHAVLDLNRRAQERLRCRAEVRVIPGAGHLFEEPGTLGAAADAARAWFLEHLVRSTTKAG